MNGLIKQYFLDETSSSDNVTIKFPIVFNKICQISNCLLSSSTTSLQWGEFRTLGVTSYDTTKFTYTLGGVCPTKSFSFMGY